ncbi:3-methyladenine DNA glycosylase [Blastococcus sp. SYSU DS0541]
MQLEKRRLPASTWTELSTRHADRADALTAGHRSRSARGEKHAVEDFLFTYYNTRPSLLRRWHPGAGVALAPTNDGPAPHAGWRWYRTDPDGNVSLDVAALLVNRGETVQFILRLLTATAARPAFTGCFGLHEWAMAYRQDEHRHPLPLRLGQTGTDAVVEQHQIRCTHFDAFRFFTPSATPLNHLQPTRESQPEMEQPGCLHAAMDCHKWSMKLGPAVPGDLALDCFELARDVRVLDMQASPYDLGSYGIAAVAIETPAGKAEYVKHQKALTNRADALRARLVFVCEQLIRA